MSYQRFDFHIHAATLADQFVAQRTSEAQAAKRQRVQHCTHSQSQQQEPEEQANSTMDDHADFILQTLEDADPAVDNIFGDFELPIDSLQLNDAAQITNPDNIADALVQEDFQLENLEDSDNLDHTPEAFQLENLDNLASLNHTSAQMALPLRRMSLPDLEDTSQEVPLRRSLFNISDFEFLLSMWCDQAGVTCKNYESLREVLESLQNLNDLKRLPEKLDTLKHRCHQCLPSLKLQRKEINVSSLKLPTMAPNQKPSAIVEVNISKDYIYFVDPKELF
ncbi:MAG: hypothetical protein M1830_008387 [Pleopsidium flavum]|nr:MAG: hypothetical protein M1830_008387 [Pleopsidium flavum]